MNTTRKILVLGASGLIGRFVTDDLRGRGFRVVGVARRLSASQKNGALDLELPLMSMDAAAMARLLRDQGIGVVVNCVGVLQDGPGSIPRSPPRRSHSIPLRGGLRGILVWIPSGAGSA